MSIFEYSVAGIALKNLLENLRLALVGRNFSAITESRF